MPQMSPMQWTMFFNYFNIIMISSSIIINFISINNKITVKKHHIYKKFIMPKW